MMLYNTDIHKHYIDRQHRIIRRLLFFVLVVIACAIGTITALVAEVRDLKKQVEFCRRAIR